MTTLPQKLTAENAQVVNLVQCMIGLVTPNLRFVTLEMTSDGGVCVRFLLACEDPCTREDVEDIVFEFEALQTGQVVDMEVMVDDLPWHELKIPGRIVYGRKEE